MKKRPTNKIPKDKTNEATTFEFLRECCEAPSGTVSTELKTSATMFEFGLIKRRGKTNIALVIEAGRVVFE